MKSIREAAKYQPLYVPWRTLNWVEMMGIQVSTPPNENHDPRDYLDGNADLPEEAREELTAEDQKRIAEGVEALREAQRAENAYERAKYN